MDSIIANISLTFSILQKLFAEIFFVLTMFLHGFSSIYRFFSLQTPFLKWRQSIWFLCKKDYSFYFSNLKIDLS